MPKMYSRGITKVAKEEASQYHSSIIEALQEKDSRSVTREVFYEKNSRKGAEAIQKKQHRRSNTEEAI